MALFGIILLSCFPLRGAEGVCGRISCAHTHMRACAQAPRSSSSSGGQEHIQSLRNSLCASHDCSTGHLHVPWGWFQAGPVVQQGPACVPHAQ